MELGATPSTPLDRAPRFLRTRSHATMRNAGSATRLNRSSNRRRGSSIAHWCSLVWIFSTRCSASYRSGHGASMFISVLLSFQFLYCELAGSLRHVAGFPDLGLLRTLRPVLGPSADDVLCRFRPGWSGGRRHEDGSHVHHRPVDGIGASFSPAGLASAIPQHVTVAPDVHSASRPFLPVVGRSGALHPGHPPDLTAGLMLFRGSTTGSFIRTPLRLACRARAVWRCQSVPALSRLLPPFSRLRGQAASSFSGLLRQAAGGALSPTRSCGASWRTHP